MSQSPPGPPAAWAEPRPPAWLANPRGGTNGFAVASLILGSVGGVLLSVIFGILALTQIRRTGEKGRGMAVAGLVLSGIWSVMFVGVLGYLVGTGAAERGGVIATGFANARSEVRVGDCIGELPDDEVLIHVPTVACERPHAWEVFAVVTLPAGRWPGEDAVYQAAEERCDTELERASPTASRDPGLGLSYLMPTPTSWRQGDHEVTCLAHSAQPSAQPSGEAAAGAA